MNPLYILNTNSLLDVWFENISFILKVFFFFFILLTMSFAVQKLFVCGSPTFRILLFLSYNFGIKCKIYICISPRPVSWSLPPMVSFSHFMFSDLTIKLLIYFELSLCVCCTSQDCTMLYNPRSSSFFWMLLSFFFLNITVHFSQNCLLKRLSFLHCIFLASI